MAGLSEEEANLLIALVDADRSVPRAERQPFYAFSHAMSHNLMFSHLGLTHRFEAYPADLIELGRLGLLDLRREQQGDYSFDITKHGYATYEALIGARSTPAQTAEAAVGRYVDSLGFQARHPEAYGLWAEAAQLLWSPEGERHLTKIGHLCREATQAFADSLLRLKPVEGVTSNRVQVKQRVQAVLERLALSSSTAALLEALHAYWCRCVDQIQRQEHGATKEGDRLTWEDGRLVVFTTLFAMSELDRVVQGRAT